MSAFRSCASRVRFWDRNGKPLGLFMWGYLYEHRTYRFLARTQIVSAAEPDPVFFVSTIWRGLDPCRIDPPLPLIFETGVLTSADGLIEEEASAVERHAIAIHDETVKRVARRLVDPVVIHEPIVPSSPRGGWAVTRTCS